MTLASSAPPDASHREDAAARFRALAEVARVGTGSPADVLRRAAEAARTALGAASASLSVFELDRSQIRCLVNVGDLAPAEEEEPEDEVYSYLEFNSLAALVDGHRGLAARVDRPDVMPDFVRLLVELGKGSAMSLPIPLDGRVWGELYVTRHVADAPFEDLDLDFGLAVAAQVGAALATADHVRRVQQLAYSDALTGLANRRAVDEWMDQAFERRARDGSPVGLLMCDLNGLKHINDEQGHDAGDRALVRFATLLSAAAAHLPGAIVGRLGGDEFCIAAAGVPSDHLVASAEELCRLVLRSPLEGVSCGVASTSDDVGPVDSAGRLFRLADAAQYRAKRSRSARPVVAGRSLPPEAAVRMEDHPHAPADRRTVRGRDRVDQGRLLVTCLDVLDSHRSGTVEQRLAALGDALAVRLDASGWWLSGADDEAGVVRTLQYSQFRSVQGVPTGPGSSSSLGAEFTLAEYPLTEALLAGGAAVVLADDPDADPAELALLDGFGAVALLEAGATGADGRRWLLELFGDELSVSLADLAPMLRTLVVLAVAEAGTPDRS